MQVWFEFFILFKNKDYNHIYKEKSNDYIQQFDAGISRWIKAYLDNYQKKKKMIKARPNTPLCNSDTRYP